MDGEVLEVLNLQRVGKLKEWQRRMSITLTQVNGQRKYGGPPPDWRGPAPGPGCEVFISQIPRDVFEDSLIPLFQSVAPLYEFRLMMNFSGQNRGFAYAKYADPASAVATIRALNQHPLQAGIRLSVRRSTEKRQLSLGEVPSGMGREELLLFLQMVSDGVERVTLTANGPKGKDVSALVLYSSHYAASMAKKVLVQAFKKQFHVCVSVRWMTYGSRFKPDECPEETVSLKPSVPPPRFQVKQPAHLCNCRDSVLPLSSPPVPIKPSTPPHHNQHFSRAVGGPAPHMSNGMVPLTTRKPELPPCDAVGQLKWLCELYRLGTPLYDVHYNHTGPDGFLYFTYRVVVPQLPVPLRGVVQILPGTSFNTMESEVRQATAKQVIKAMCQRC